MNADNYRPGPNGFIIAKWVCLDMELELELPNSRLEADSAPLPLPAGPAPAGPAGAAEAAEAAEDEEVPPVSSGSPSGGGATAEPLALKQF